MRAAKAYDKAALMLLDRIYKRPTYDEIFSCFDMSDGPTTRGVVDAIVEILDKPRQSVLSSVSSYRKRGKKEVIPTPTSFQDRYYKQFSKARYD